MPQREIVKRNRCLRCHLQPRHCLCGEVQVVSPQVRVLLFRHWKEAWRSTNSARIAELAVDNAELHDFGAVEIPPIPQHLIDDAQPAWLLFPSDADHPAPPKGAPLPRTLIVVDGSWRQARRMVRRIPGLIDLPRYSPSPRPIPPDRIRKPPFDGGMATLEALGRALTELEGEAVGQPLEDLFALFIARIREQRGY
ncbi:MAG: tRNA-uridine aminocarboxypropyltransferase [Myxococcota bacterium]